MAMAGAIDTFVQEELAPADRLPFTAIVLFRSLIHLTVPPFQGKPSFLVPVPHSSHIPATSGDALCRYTQQCVSLTSQASLSTS